MNPTRIVSVLCFLCFLCCSFSLSPQASAQDAQRDKEKIRKCWEAARPSMVGLEIQLRKKSRTERGEDDHEALSDEEQRMRIFGESRQPLDTWGVVIDADGTILTPDLRIKSDEVEKITATASDGAPFEVKLDAMGRHHDFVTLKPAEPRKDLKPVAFEEFKRFELGASYYTAFIERVDQQWHINVSPYIVTNAPLRDEKSWLLIDQMRRGSLLFDSEAQPVGIPLDDFLWIDGDRDSFIGRAILSDERIAMSDIEKKTGEISKALAEATRKLEARIREDRPIEYGERGSGLLTLYGLPIDEKGTYLIPRDLGAELIRRIEEPRALGSDKPDPAEFVGSFKEFGAALIRVPGAATKPSIVTDVSGMELGTLYWTASLQEKFGRAFVEVKANRVFRLERGPKGDFKPAFRWGARPGTFVLDFDGRPIGVYTDQRKKEDMDEAAIEGGPDYRFYGGRWRGGSSGARRILLFGELKDVLADPAPHFDPRAVPMTTKKEKTLVWVGIEYQDISKALAESLKIEDKELTNEGKRGLLITVVYPDSPAAKVGFQPDDILLTLKREGEAKPADLAGAGGGYYDEYRDFRGFRGGRRLYERGAPWRSRSNYLTTMMTEIGAGKKVTIELLRGRERKQVEMTLEESPTDFETAEKYKDEALGLTVKELTYEVRHFQRVDSGVVIAKVESGSRAEVGKLETMSIITEVNGAPVKDPAHFRDLIAQRRAQGDKSVTLAVRSFGQTRMADVEIGAKEK